MNKKSVKNRKKKRISGNIFTCKRCEFEELIIRSLKNSVLTFFKKDNKLLFAHSANELSDLLKETNFGISPTSCYSHMAQPLFDKNGKVYDILLSAIALHEFIYEVKKDNRAYLNVEIKHICKSE